MSVAQAFLTPKTYHFYACSTIILRPDETTIRYSSYARYGERETQGTSLPHPFHIGVPFPGTRSYPMGRGGDSGKNKGSHCLFVFYCQRKTKI